MYSFFIQLQLDLGINDRVFIGLGYLVIRVFLWVFVDKKLRSVSLVYFFSIYKNV